MQENLNHLPEKKQKELKIITDIICEIAKPEMIILFGSYARGTWVEDTYPDRRYRYVSDFDILVIVETRSESVQSKLEREIEEILDQKLELITPISVIVHDIEFVNRRLSKGQYFFGDIKKEGIYLYNTECFQLKEPKELSSKERQKLAQEDFDYWMGRAEVFHKHYKISFAEGELRMGAFMLHQTTEHLYSAILLVFTRYKPNTHDLSILRKFTNTIDNQLAMVFPLNSEENKHLFKLLRKAYVDARYKPSYLITQEELETLANQVEALKKLVETLCLTKIASFTN